MCWKKGAFTAPPLREGTFAPIAIQATVPTFLAKTLPTWLPCAPRHFTASASWICLSVRPAESFQSLRPFAERPRITAAASEGELNV